MLRKAVRPLTGKLSRDVDVTLGTREDGKPGITLHPHGREVVCLADPDVIRNLIGGLYEALRHLEAK